MFTRRLMVVALVAMVAAGAFACGASRESDGTATNDESADGRDSTAGIAANPNESIAAYATQGPGGQPATKDSARNSVAPVQGTSGGSGEADLPASQSDRKIIFQAKLALEAEHVRNTFDDVNRIARTAGGYIDKSSLYDRTDAEGKPQTYGEVTVRVPSQQYGEVLAQLRGLPGAKVQREDSSSNEVTEQYTDLQSRMRNLERTEQQYLKLLEQAKTIQEILTVNDRLTSVRSQIEQIQGRLKVLDNLTELATISTTIAPAIPAKAQPKDDGKTTPAEAFADAWESSLEAVGYVVKAGAIVAVALIWLTIPALVVIFGLRYARRGRQATAG